MGEVFLLAAGGTGGHLFPAEALAHELVARGHVVDLVTDARAGRIGGTFPGRAVHVVPSATIAGRDPLSLARTAFTLARGLARALPLVRRVKPRAVIGFGGYPTLPPLVAARLLGVPAVVHEANAVAGRANRLLARFAAVATSFPDVAGFARTGRSQVQTGLPVRPAVLEAARVPFPSRGPDGGMRLLVFGGSQGAHVFAGLVPAAFALLPEETRARIRLVQQCRAEDLDATRAALGRLAVEAELAPFFADLPRRIAGSHLVLARAGASTVAELAVIGRPAILVPLPHAVDQDQAHNASAFAAAGGGWRIDQSELTPERLAAELAALYAAPERLESAAAAARGLAAPDAASRLADLVERVAAGGARQSASGSAALA